MPGRLWESAGVAARLMGMIFCSLLVVGLAGAMNTVWAGNSSSARQARLPDPLTLKEALSYAD